MSNENTQANNAPTPQSLVLDEQDISVAVGRTRCLWAQVTPADAENYTISWSSSNPSVASVSDGNVTAHATGPAVISAWIPGTSLSASCNVEVVPFVPVNSISVTPESLDLYLGEGYCLAAEVCPTNATNPVITWTSKDEEIASVGEISGVVYAHKDGQTIITATVNDGTVEKTDTCILTVNTRPPVRGVNIEEDAVYMNQGERCTLHANVYPADAADRGVIWVSDNEAVAKVGACSGEVEAISAGSARISAVTQNLEFSDCVPVKVYKDTVTISWDQEHATNAVHFHQANKTWLCLNHDRVFEGHTNTYLINLSNLNYYQEVTAENGSTYNIVREYSDRELQFLFAIDPHGVADYVQRYAAEKDGLVNTILYKDRIFKLLFGRDPYHFERNMYGEWYYSDATGSSSMSESECLFGMHPIYDIYTLTHFLNVIHSIISAVCGLPLNGTKEKVAKFVSNYFVNTLALGNAAVNNQLHTYAADQLIDSFVDDIDGSWILGITSISDTLYALSDAMVPQKNFCNGVISYCVDRIGYEVFVDTKDAGLKRMEEIQDAINWMEENA